jgi:CRISPR/Cas system-associated endonuclease Cas1
MKTLQEMLREKTLPQGRYFLTHMEILEIVKEWLEQKLDKLPNRLEYYHSNEPEQMQTLGKVKVLKEILGELSVPAKDITMANETQRASIRNDESQASSQKQICKEILRCASISDVEGMEKAKAKLIFPNKERVTKK